MRDSHFVQKSFFVVDFWNTWNSYKFGEVKCFLNDGGKDSIFKIFYVIETFLSFSLVLSQTSISADLRQFQSPLLILLIFLLKQSVPVIVS